MRSNEERTNFTTFIDGMSACHEKCVRNKRKFPSESRLSLRITPKGSSHKPDKETETDKEPMNSLNSFHESRSSTKREQTISNSEINLQRPEEAICNHVQYMSDRDMKVGHDQRCKHLDSQAGNWDADTERQLEELLMDYLESICDSAIKKVASYGYSLEEARKAVLSVGFRYHTWEPLSNIGEKVLLYLASASPKSDEKESSDFKKLHKFIVVEMVRALRDIRPSLKTGDALWCLIACDMNMAQASLMQGAASFPAMDSSPSLNPMMASVSIGACSPASLASSPSANELEPVHLTDLTDKLSSERRTSNVNGAVVQTTFMLQNGLPQHEKDGSESPVLSVDGHFERNGKENKCAPVALKLNSTSFNTFRSATSLCSTSSDNCPQDTALSIGLPVRSSPRPCSPSKDFLKSSASSERGKAFAEWSSPSTSSELVKPTIPLMVQNSSKCSGELAFQEYNLNTSLAVGSPSGTHDIQNMQLASGSQPFSTNVAAERFQPGSSTTKTPKNSSPRTSNKCQHFNVGSSLNGSSLSAAGKELSLATSSVMDCPKLDVRIVAANESITGPIQLARELDYSGVPDSKGLLLEDLLHRVKDLEATLQERSKWAREKVTHAAKRLISDFTELKALRLEREEAARLKKEKQALEDNSKKKVSDMEITLRKTVGQAECVNTAMRRLEIENAELRAEMEAAKLSAAESVANDKAVAKREKKALKKEQTWERQRAKLQEEIASEKRKMAQLQLDLSQLKEESEATEMRWRQEVKAKEAAVNLAESERRAKEQLETAAKKREDSLRRKVEADARRHQDDIARLEDEIAHLLQIKDSPKQTLLHLNRSSEVTGINKSTHPIQEVRNINLRLCQEAADVLSSLGRELPRERECVMCMSEERSVVFLPCAHQIICVECNDLHETQGMKDCPSCRTFIEQRIRVYGAKA